jgi:hypothetical protein
MTPSRPRLLSFFFVSLVDAVGKRKLKKKKKRAKKWGAAGHTNFSIPSLPTATYTGSSRHSCWELCKDAKRKRMAPKKKKEL